MEPRILTIVANDPLSPKIKLCIHKGEIRRKGGYNYPLYIGRSLGNAEPGEAVRVEVYPDVIKRIEWYTPGTVPEWLLEAVA